MSDWENDSYTMFVALVGVVVVAVMIAVATGLWPIMFLLVFIFGSLFGVLTIEHLLEQRKIKKGEENEPNRI